MTAVDAQRQYLLRCKDEKCNFSERGEMYDIPNSLQYYMLEKNVFIAESVGAVVDTRNLVNNYFNSTSAGINT